MNTSTGTAIGPLGVIRLERGTESGQALRPNAGTLTHPATFPFPTLVDVAEGVWVENVVRGGPNVENAFLAAAQRLVAQGAAAITTTCGFTHRYQASLAGQLPVPFLSSSLLLLPNLLRQIDPKGAIAVMTYDAQYCDRTLIGLDDPRDLARLVVGGIEGSAYWHNELKKPLVPTSAEQIEADVWQRLQAMRAERPDIQAVLFECAGFPAVARGIRRCSGLPVYDIVGLCLSTMRALGG